MDFVRLHSRQVALPVRFLNVTKEKYHGNERKFYQHLSF